MSRFTSFHIPLSRRTPVLASDKDEFRRCFGVRAFALKHGLSNNPLFSLTCLASVAKRCRVGASRGVTNVNASWSDVDGGRVAASVEEVQTTPTLMKLVDLGSVDPAYRDIEAAFLSEVQELLGRPIINKVRWSTLTVFISSPHIVTPFHIDHEQNVLCQISGEKDVCLYDPADRELLPDKDIERFYFGERTGLRYPEGMQDRGRVFRLGPGDAVHHPSLAGHWVKNGPNLSISVSLSYCERGIDRRARVYQVNYCLRKLGIRPLSPGRSPLLDGLKAGVLGMISTRHPRSYVEAVHSGPVFLKAWNKSLRGR